MPIVIEFLGTGSATPTLVRNVSAVAIGKEGELTLFDCGEGTQLQFQKASLRCSRIKYIFISHLHGDHINGLPGLLMSMDLNERNEPLYIYGPPGLKGYYNSLSRWLQLKLRFEININVIEAGIVLDREDLLILAAPLKHTITTFGYVWIEKDLPGRFDILAAKKLEIPSGPLYGQLQRGQAVTLNDGRIIKPEAVIGPSRAGRRITYCVDTVPCKNAIQLARNADILIYDGTFIEKDGDWAIARGHSTMLQAARIAKTAKVRSLYLTHISHRYDNIRVDLSEARKIFKSTYLAKDLMKVILPRPA